MDVGCENCAILIRPEDVYIQFSYLLLGYVLLVATGTLLTGIVAAGVPLSVNAVDRLRTWQEILSGHPGYSSFIFVFHLYQFTLWVRHSYSLMSASLSSIEMIVSFVYFGEILICILSGSSKGSWRHWGKTVPYLFVDAIVFGAPFVRAIVYIDGRQSWFSFTFVAALRIKRVSVRYFKYIGLEDSELGELIYQVVTKSCVLLFLVPLFLVAETLDGPYDYPTFPRDQFSPDRLKHEWTLLGSIFYVVTTVTTVGYGDHAPKSFLGRMFTMAVIVSGVALFSILLNDFLEAYTLAFEGNKMISSKREIIIISGKPTVEMIDSFLLEFYHPENFEESELLDVCMVLLSERMVEQVRTRMSKKEWLPFRDHLFIVKGSLMDWNTITNARLGDAVAVYLMPSLQVTNVTAADTEVAILCSRIKDIISPKAQMIIMLHRQESKNMIIGFSEEQLSIIVIQHFKYSCIGKTCAGLPGFITLVNNLCKCVSDIREPDKANWQQEYDNGLGTEMYQIPLSDAYIGCKYSDAVIDFIQRSPQKNVVLIGLCDIGTGLKLHPGENYVISAKDNEAVVLAQDKSAVVQAATKGDLKSNCTTLIPRGSKELEQNEKNKKVSYSNNTTPCIEEMDAEDSLAVKEDGQVDPWLKDMLIQGSLPLDDMAAGMGLDVGETPNDPESPTKMRKKKTEEKKEKMLTFAKIAQTRKIAPEDIEDDDAASDDEMMDSEFILASEMPSGSRADTIPKPVGPPPAENWKFRSLDKIKSPLSKTPTLARRGTTYHIGEDEALAQTEKLLSSWQQQVEEGKNNSTDRTNQNNENETKIDSDMIPDDFAGGHALYMSTRQNGSYNGKIIPDAWGIRFFIKPLPAGMPVVVLAPVRPPEWNDIKDGRNPKYYIRGTPLRLFDLHRAHFTRASSFVVDTSHHRSGMPKTLQHARGAEANVPLEATKESVRGGVMGDPGLTEDNAKSVTEAIYITRVVENELWKKIQEDKANKPRFDIDEEDDFFIPNIVTELNLDEWTYLLPLGLQVGKIPPILRRDRSSAGLKRDKKFALDRITRRKDYYRTARFAQGNLFVGTHVIISLAANTFFNSKLPLLVETLTEKSFEYFKVPAVWDQQPYPNFFQWLLKTRNLLAVSIYRKAESLASDVGADCTTGLVTHAYMYICPGKDVLVRYRDNILCMLPSRGINKARAAIIKHEKMALI